MNKGAAFALLTLLGIVAYKSAEAAVDYGNGDSSSFDFFALDPFGNLSDNTYTLTDDPAYNVGEDAVPHISIDGGGNVGAWRVNEYPKYASAIRDAEISNNIPVDLLGRLLYQESRYRKDVIDGTNRSPVGATGIAQFMPVTGAEVGLVTFDADGKTIIKDDRLNPYASVAAAGRYLARMYRLFGDWSTALMAYNWGPGNVKKHIQGLGAPVPMETSQYVAQITADVPVA